MRGRRPEMLTIHRADIAELERIAHSDTSPWYQVRRARIVLEIAAGQRRENLAAQLECDVAEKGTCLISMHCLPANGI